MLNALLVDDEEACCEVLDLLLRRHCPEVQVVASCRSAADALLALQTYKINLVFLDIEMPHATGFDFLQSLPSVDFDFVFTTSYDQYAIKALRFSALDYLLKPVDRRELQTAVHKAAQRHRPPEQRQLDALWQHLQKPPRRQLALPTVEGLQMVAVEALIRCSAKSNYTLLHFRDGQTLVVSKTLKEVEAVLAPHQFLRVHHSHVVNLAEVKKYLRGEGGLLLMSDGSAVDVSRSRKDAVIGALQTF